MQWGLSRLHQWGARVWNTIKSCQAAILVTTQIMAQIVLGSISNAAKSITTKSIMSAHLE